MSEADLLIEDGCMGVAVAAGFGITMMRTPLFSMMVINRLGQILGQVGGSMATYPWLTVPQLFDKMSTEKEGVG